LKEIDDQNYLLYEASSNLFSNKTYFKDPGGDILLTLVKKSAWFTHKYEIFRNGYLISTLLTKNAKFKPLFIFDYEAQAIEVRSNRFMKELTFYHAGTEIAKGSRKFKVKGSEYGIAINTACDQELFAAIIIIIDIIRRRRNQRKRGG